MIMVSENEAASKAASLMGKRSSSAEPTPSSNQAFAPDSKVAVGVRSGD
jgi:hypothetical protein